MSQWANQIREHTVWQQMKNLGPAIDLAESREGIDPQTVDTLERIRAILAFAGKRLAGADVQLLYLAPLDGMAGALQNAFSQIEAFTTDGDVNRVANANSNADIVLAHLPAITYPFVADDWNVLSDASVSYRSALERNLDQVQKAVAAIHSQFSALQQRITELGNETSAERAKVAALSTDFQGQYSSAEGTRNQEFASAVQTALSKIETESTTLQQRLVDLGAEIGAERSRLTALASDFQLQFSTAQESRNKDFAEGQTTRQEKFGNLIADYNQRLTDRNAEFSKQRDVAFQEYEKTVAALTDNYGRSATKILEKIQHQKNEVEKLVGVIGNLGVTSGYLKTANHAKKMTWLWQGVTVAAMGGLIFIAVKAFLPLVQGAFTWEGFAGRVFVSLTVGVLAAYAGSQGDKYMQIEGRNRKLALELEAIGPYLAPLPVEKQEEFRLLVGERSFGREDDGYGRADKKSPATLLDMFLKSKELRQFILDVVKSATPKA